MESIHTTVSIFKNNQNKTLKEYNSLVGDIMYLSWNYQNSKQKIRDISSVLIGCADIFENDKN